MCIHLGETSLMNAAWKGHTEIVKILIENEADVNLQANAGYFLNYSSLHLSIYPLIIYKTRV